LGVAWGCAPKQEPAIASPALPTKTEAPPKPSARFEKPKTVRGIYLTAWSAGSARKMDKMLELLKNTELNSMVIDVRDAGHVYFKTGIALADETGATTVAVVHPDKLMDRLAKEGVYPIARIACFRDNFVPKKRPDLAVRAADGQVWKDRAGYTWLDPYNKENWDYLGKVVDFALELGFPEVQLDYVRFPSEGKTSSMSFPAKKGYEMPEATPTEVVAAFSQYVAGKVRAKGAVLSADIFGIMSIGLSDQGIGQALETVAEPFDLICPMVYPSHFAKGEYGIKDPESAPYHIIKKSLADYVARLPDKPIRPWLQDFSLRVSYGADQVKSQIKAAMEMGYDEFLLWNPKNLYTAEAVKTLPEVAATPKATTEAKSSAAQPESPKAPPPGSPNG
jgi:hypothetical protein